MKIPEKTTNKGYTVTAVLHDGGSVNFRFASPRPTSTGNGRVCRGRGFLGALGLTNDYEYDGTLEPGHDNMRDIKAWMEEAKKIGVYIGDGHSIKVEDVKSFSIMPFEYEVLVKNDVGYNCYA